MENIYVIGSGSFGCALSLVLSDNGHKVHLISHSKAECEKLSTSHTSSKLPNAKLPENIIHTTDINNIENADLIVLALPSTETRSVANALLDIIPSNQRIVTVSKGIEESTLYTQSEILREVLPEVRIGVLSGPSHAEEVVNRLPTVVVAGSKDPKLAEYMQDLFMNPNFRVYTSDDVVGIELGGSLKNVIAIAAGVADVLGFGYNIIAALITRGIKEISTLGIAMGARADTLSGLCGVGDLIVTCQSKHSRNRRAGSLIGQGLSPEAAIAEINMVVEGFFTAKAAKKLGEKYKVDLPIIEEVNNVLFYGREPKVSVKSLMEREKRPEHN